MSDALLRLLTADPVLMTLCPQGIGISLIDQDYLVTAATDRLETAWEAAERIDAILSSAALRRIGRLAYADGDRQRFGGVYRAVFA